jgi:hypothetical protein
MERKLPRPPEKACCSRREYHLRHSSRRKAGQPIEIHKGACRDRVRRDYHKLMKSAYNLFNAI